MLRIVHATAESDKFGTGKDGFTEGSPPLTPATIVTDDIANAWQEELVRAIELSGQVLSSSYYQTWNAHNRYGPADFCRADSATDAGSWLPQLTSLGTFWVTPGAGLVGALENGAAWVLSNDRVFRVALSDDEIALQNFDAYTFTDDRDNYIAISLAGVLEVNETALGAGEPTPTVGFDNVLKVVTTGGAIISCEALRPAYPRTQCYEMDLGDIPAASRKAGDSAGFRWRFWVGTPNEMNVVPFTSGGTSIGERIWIVEDTRSGGDASDQEWRGSFKWIPASHTDPRREWRTHNGTTAEDTRFIDDRSFVYNQSTGASYVTAETWTLPHDGATVTLKWGAVDSSDVTRVAGGSHEVLLEKDGAAETTIVGPSVADPEAAGITARVVTDGTNIIVEAFGEAAKTWRFTGKIEIVPIDVTA